MELAILNDIQNSKNKVQKNLNDVYSKLLPTDNEKAVNYSEWLKDKTEMRVNHSINKPFPIIRKGVYYVNFGRNIGSEQEKDRPAVIIWTQYKAPIALVVPISDEYKNSSFWFHVHLSSVDTALVEQMRVISKARIRVPIRTKGQIRMLLPEELIQINEAIDKLKFDIE